MPQATPPKPNPARTPIQAALVALAEVCATPFPDETHLPRLQELDLSLPEDVAQLGNVFQQLRMEAAIHVVRAVRGAARPTFNHVNDPRQSAAASQDTESRLQDATAAYAWPGSLRSALMPGGSGRATAPDRGSHACHVAIVGNVAEVADARALYPQRVIVVAGGPVSCGWLSALLLVPLQHEEDLRWLRLAREACCARHGGGREVAAFAPTAPGDGQDAGSVVIVWDASDLDAVTAVLGCSKWVTLWGGFCHQRLTGPVVTVGAATSPLHHQWLRQAVDPWLAPGVEISVAPRPPKRT